MTSEQEWADAVARTVEQFGSLDILVNNAGSVDTPILGGSDKQALIDVTPMGRLGRPDAIATVIRFLASNEAGFMTGSEIAVDGGFTAR